MKRVAPNALATPFQIIKKSAFSPHLGGDAWVRPRFLSGWEAGRGGKPWGRSPRTNNNLGINNHITMEYLFFLHASQKMRPLGAGGKT